MSVMILMLINFKPLLKFIIINIIAGISWQPLLISQLRFLNVTPFYTAWLFLHGFHFFVFRPLSPQPFFFKSQALKALCLINYVDFPHSARTVKAI